MQICLFSPLFFMHTAINCRGIHYAIKPYFTAILSGFSGKAPPQTGGRFGIPVNCMITLS